MLRDILVCLEGSASTRAATACAIEVAKQTRGTLFGLSVVDEPDIRAGAAMGIGGSSYKRHRDDALLRDAEEKAQAWARNFEEACAAAAVTARTRTVSDRPAHAILAEMQTHDLAVFGAAANFRFETEVSDARTRDGVLHRARKPVLVVPEGAEPAQMTAGTVVIAYDGSAASKRALASFASSGLAQNRSVVVVSVDDDGSTAWDMAMRAVLALGELGVHATADNVVSVLPIADTLIARLEQHRAALLVMGAYASSRLSELVWGSVTRAVLERLTRPVFMHH